MTLHPIFGEITAMSVRWPCPIFRGDHVYATDSTICVRAPKEPAEPETVSERPAVEKLNWSAKRVEQIEYPRGLATEMIDCERCDGSGVIRRCTTCDGRGECACPNCGDSHICGDCGGFGIAYEGLGASRPCECCNGAGKRLFQRVALPDGRKLDAKYIRLLERHGAELWRLDGVTTMCGFTIPGTMVEGLVCVLIS